MKTILFIEDEASLQKTFSDVLEREGFKVVSALDGESGLEMAKAERPTLILLDLLLPRMSGFDVLKSLKETEETKEIPVIVLTNLEGMTDIERILELGATSYLVKANYTLDEVVKKIKAALPEES